MQAKFFDKDKNEIVLDVNEHPVKTLQGIENSLVMVAMEKIIQLLEENPIVQKLTDKFEQEGVKVIKKDRESVEDYIEVYNDLCNTFCGFYVSLQYMKETNSAINSSDIFLVENIKYCDQLSQLFEASGEYLELLQKAEQITNSEQSKEDFLRIITRHHKKMDVSFNKIIKIIEDANSGLVGDVNIYKILQDMVKLVTDKMDIRHLKAEEKNAIGVTIEKNPADIERMKYIDKANVLFTELRLDFMRDLEAQVPYSARDKYENFLNKYEKFTQSFQMPLIKTTSLGRAKEACTQIQNMMDYVSYISSESYATILPAENEDSNPSIFYKG